MWLPRRFTSCACNWIDWTREYSVCRTPILDPMHEPDCLSAPVSHSAGVHPLPPGPDPGSPAAALVHAPAADRPLEAVPRPQGPQPRRPPASGLRRSEERRVGKECTIRGLPVVEKTENMN